MGCIQSHLKKPAPPQNVRPEAAATGEEDTGARRPRRRSSSARRLGRAGEIYTQVYAEEETPAEIVYRCGMGTGGSISGTGTKLVKPERTRTTQMKPEETERTRTTLMKPEDTGGFRTPLMKPEETERTRTPLMKPEETDRTRTPLMKPEETERTRTTQMKPEETERTRTTQMKPEETERTRTTQMKPEETERTRTTLMKPEETERTRTMLMKPEETERTRTTLMKPEETERTRTILMKPEETERTRTTQMKPEETERTRTILMKPEETERTRTTQMKPEETERTRTILMKPEETERTRTTLIKPEETERTRTILMKPEETERTRTTLMKPEETERNRTTLMKPEETERTRTPLMKPEETERTRTSLMKPEETERTRIPLMKPEETERTRTSLMKPEETERTRIPLMKPEETERTRTSLMKPEETERTRTSLMKPEETERTRTSLMKPEETERTRPSLMKPEVTEGTSTPLMKPEVTERTSTPLKKPEVMERIRTSLMKPEVTEGISTPLMKPEVTEGTSTPLMKPEVVEGLRTSLMKREETERTRTPLMKPEVVEGIRTSLMKREETERTRTPLMKPEVVEGIRTLLMKPEDSEITSVKPGTVGTTSVKPGTVGTTSVKPGTVGTTSVKPGTVGTTSVKPGTVGTTSVKPGTVGTTSVKPGTVGTTSVKPGTVGTTSVKPGTVGTTSVKPGTVGTTSVKPGTVGTTSVKPDTVGTTSVNPGTVGTTSVKPGTVGTTSVKPGTVETTAVKPGTVETTAVKPGTVGTTAVKPGTVETTAVKSGTVGTTAVKPGTVGTTSVKPGTVETTAVKPGTVGTTAVKPGTVGTTSVKPGTVGTTSVKPGTVGTTSVKPGTVGTTSVKPGTVGTTSVKPGTVGTTSVKPGTVGTTSVKPGTVGTTSVKPGTVGTTSVKPDTVGTTSVKPGTVGTTSVKLGTVGTTSVKPGTVETTAVKPGTVETTAVKPGTVGTTAVKPGTVETTAVKSGTGGTTAVKPGTVGTTSVKPGTVETTAVKPGTVGTTAVKPGTVETTAVKPGTVGTTAVEPGTVETTAVKPGTVGTTPVKPGFLGTISTNACHPREAKVKPVVVGTTPNNAETIPVKPLKPKDALITPVPTTLMSVHPSGTTPRNVAGEDGTKPIQTRYIYNSQSTPLKPQYTSSSESTQDKSRSFQVKPETVAVKPGSAGTIAVKPGSAGTTSVTINPKPIQGVTGTAAGDTTLPGDIIIEFGDFSSASRGETLATEFPVSNTNSQKLNTTKHPKEDQAKSKLNEEALVNYVTEAPVSFDKLSCCLDEEIKPTVVYAKLKEYDIRVNFCAYVGHRLPPGLGIIRMEQCVEHDTRSTIVAIHCRSKRVAQQVTGELHRGNATSTTIWCFDSMQEARGQRVRSHEETEQSFENHLKQMAQKLEVVLDQNYAKIREVENKLQDLARKKSKHMSLQDFAECQSSGHALKDKEKELGLQRYEFLKYLENSIKELKTAKESPSFESIAQNIRRDVAIECNRLTNAFPIYARRADILATVQKNQVCVIIGETGSGKSTQMAQYFYQAGLAGSGMIACTQPRKIAATSLATHVAKELGTSVGQVVGYKVGMQVRKTNLTKVLYMTDHILLNECLQDEKLSAYSCIIIDEAHERSIYTDLLLVMIKECLKDRPELRVIITSATINPKVFVKYFEQCPLLQVSGRMFPVDVEWQEPIDGVDSFENYQDKAVRKAIDIHQTQGEGDILVFLTKPIETEKCCVMFQDMMEGRRTNYVTLQLHGRLQGDEQQRVFDPPPPGKRKIVFATNSAETSVTIPGIKYVIDTGLVNEMKFDAVRKISTLAVTMVTQSSANQRKGRAGRLGPGKCYRLYNEEDFKKMTSDALPEILKVHIGHAILKMMELGVDPMEFDFVEAPSFDAMDEAFTSLIYIGAIEDKKITELGKWIAKVPFDPQYGAFVYEAMKAGLGVEAIVVAAAIGTDTVFYRGESNGEEELADKQIIPFCHEEGDQLTTLNVFREWNQVAEKEKGKWCVKYSVNDKAVKAILETTNEVLNTLKKELKVEIKLSFAEKHKVDGVLAGLLFKALHHNLSHYLGHMKAGYNIISKSQRVEIHPSTSLFPLGSQPEWIVFDQVMRTTRDFAMQVTPVPEELVVKGIEEGWLHLQIEEAKKKRIMVVCQENVGSQMFREIVGPCYVDLRSFEEKLAATCPNSVVVVEADQDRGELRVLATESNKSSLKNSFLNVVPPIRAKYMSEESEERIGSATDHSERAVLGAGGSTVEILLPGEYKAVLINCTLDNIEQMSEKDIEQYFCTYGKVKQCIKFFRKNKNSTLWGKVVYEQSQAAVTAVEATREESDLTARPNTRVAGNQAVGFNVKIQWCRRPSRGFGFVDFKKVEDYMRALNIFHLSIGGSLARVSSAKNSPQSIHVGGLNRLVNEDVLREAIATELGIDPVKDIQRVTIIRDKVDINKEILDSYKRSLQRKMEEFSQRNDFQLDVNEPRTERDINFTAFCSFRNPEEGYAACANINNGFRLNDQVVTMKATIHSSILIHIDIFRKNEKKIEDQLNKIKSHQIRIKCKEQTNTVIVELHTESGDALARARARIQEVVRGEVIECENKPELLTLFSREGRNTLQDIMNKTQTLIQTDNRVMCVSIHGLQRQRLDARTRIEEYVQQLTHGSFSDVELMGGGRPVGVMKALILKYQVDLARLQTESGLRALRLDHRRHRLRLFGSQKSISKATDLIMQVICSITAGGAVIQDEDNPDCVTCFCPVESKDLYRLECCGHSYCRECVQLQMNTSITSKQFPIECGDKNCSAMFVWKDFVSLSQQGHVTLARLVSASVGTYVSEHTSEVRYCTTPDCPAVYRVSQTASLFTCFECGTRICTSCHVQYHDGISCAMYKAYGTDGGLREWMGQDTANRKICPGCNSHIEKIGGCKKVHCWSCKKIICWDCMNIYDTKRQCSAHFYHVHLRPT